MNTDASPIGAHRCSSVVSKRRMNRAVIFDFDGIVIDSEGLQYKSYLEVLSQYDVWVSLEEYAEFWIAAGCGPEHAVSKYGIPVTPNELRDMKNPVYHAILQREVTLMPGIVAALTRLGAELPLALATNSNRLDVGYVMDRFDLGRYFAAVVTRDDYVRPKPEPDAFLAAAAQLGVRPQDCVVVEDAYKGIIAAKRAGAKVAAIPNEYTRNNDFSAADCVLTSLDELDLALVARLLGASSNTAA
jgi:HAD superfamily hydrolase (TIGR01509 family)